ncbi:MAG TPA: ATP-binding protein [Blastocatellia bacterium]|nr:ATP-binding protein [Blastocatellia bacterium]
MNYEPPVESRDHSTQFESVASNLRERIFMLERVLRGQGEFLYEARHSLDMLEAVINAMAEGIVVTDTAGRITQVNRAALSIFNASEDELLGIFCNQLLTEGTACPHQSCSEASQQYCQRRDVLTRAGDRLLDLRVTEMRNGDHLKGYVHVMNDVTRQRALERRLAHTDRLSLAGMMISMFAHEATTPLGVIINATDLLLRDEQLASPNVELLKKIKANGNRVVDMLRNLLNFVGNKPTSFAEVDLVAVAREAIDMMNYELRKAGINVVLASPGDVPPALGDRAQLIQVLLNLIKNAREAMCEGGNLFVRIEKEVSQDGLPQIVITVDDTGPGISHDAIERIFDFFYTTKDDGTGLGLAISRQIVEGHGGEITAHNIDGGGASFAVKLPAAVARLGYDERKPAPLVLAARC